MAAHIGPADALTQRSGSGWAYLRRSPVPPRLWGSWDGSWRVVRRMRRASTCCTRRAGPAWTEKKPRGDAPTPTTNTLTHRSCSDIPAPHLASITGLNLIWQVPTSPDSEPEAPGEWRHAVGQLPVWLCSFRFPEPEAAARLLGGRMLGQELELIQGREEAILGDADSFVSHQITPSLRHFMCRLFPR
jgi:hypothetical protein